MKKKSKHKKLNKKEIHNMDSLDHNKEHRIDYYNEPNAAKS